MKKVWDEYTIYSGTNTPKMTDSAMGLKKLEQMKLAEVKLSMTIHEIETLEISVFRLVHSF